MRNDSLSSDALHILSACTADSEKQTVTLPPEQLERSRYEEVDDVLQRIGGKWNKRLKAHLFPYDPSPLLTGVLSSKELPPKNPTAFYPTPAPVVELMIECADLQCRFEGTRILEPSAGTGAIMRGIQDMQQELDRDWTVHACEILNVNRAALLSEGVELVGEDFLRYESEPYDVVIMNPPFSVEGDKTAYITHIEHAWRLLRDGGTLVSIVPGGWIFGSTKRLTQFREWVCDYLTIEEIGEGAFKDSGTLVNTYVIYGAKEETAWRTEPYNGWNSYHSWNASLWIDNDWESYRQLESALTDRETFAEFCQDVVRRLLREGVSIVLRAEDIDTLWAHYNGA